MPKPFIEKFSQSLDFYKVQYRLMLKISIFLLIFILLAIGYIFFQYFNTPKMQYFATTTSGQVIELFPKTK